MKSIFLILGLFILAKVSFAQTNISSDSLKPEKQPVLAAYERIREVPPFKLLLVNDSSMFAKVNLPKKKKTMIFIFSPSCGHCKTAVEEITKNYSKFKNINIVLATVTRYEYTKKFYDENNLKDFPNIKMGVDADYFLGGFYEVKNYPSIFLYDKKGFFKKFYNSKYTMLDIAKEL